MLVLTRQQQQRIVIGDSIVITVVGISGGKVRLGIEAPQNVRILRDELRTRDLSNDSSRDDSCSAMPLLAVDQNTELLVGTASSVL